MNPAKKLFFYQLFSIRSYISVSTRFWDVTDVGRQDQLATRQHSWPWRLGSSAGTGVESNTTNLWQFWGISLTISALFGLVIQQSLFVAFFLGWRGRFLSKPLWLPKVIGFLNEFDFCWEDNMQLEKWERFPKLLDSCMIFQMSGKNHQLGGGLSIFRSSIYRKPLKQSVATKIYHPWN